ncbi:hypothetical protein IV102_29965 [bacterium]|nr:hypothetical protein [bacterium]
MRIFHCLAALALSGAAWSAPIEAGSVQQQHKTLIDPTSAVWNSQPESLVTMAPQNIAKPILKEPVFKQLKVRGAVSQGWLFLRLEWDDKTRDAELTKALFTDACAVEFAVKGDDKDTSPFMGNPGKPVQLIHWKAIWQDDIEKGYRDVEHGYPNLYYDYYPLTKGKKARDIQGAALMYNPGRYLNNPVSQVERKDPVEEMVAEGFGTSTTQTHLDAKAWGNHTAGHWAVVLARPLSTPDPADAQIKPGSTIPVAFALWDGATKNRGGRKHFAMWTELKVGGGK